MKKLILLVLTVVVVCVSGVMISGCKKQYFDYWEDGYFKLATRKEGATYVYGLTELGKQQKVIVIPTAINGKHISGVGTSGEGFAISSAVVHGKFESDFLEKLYIPYFGSYSGTFGFDSCQIIAPNLRKIFCLQRNSLSQKIRELDIDLCYSEPDFVNGLGNRAANVSFMHNIPFDEYDGSFRRDGYYWIDDFEAGARIEILPSMEPVREGFVFTGWYKEPECINAWDFDADVTYENENTKLYAKWE